MKPSTFCSYCLKPCQTICQHDEIADEFGTQVHGPYEVSRCCGESVLTRAETARRKWNDRKFSQVSTNLHPIFEAILEDYYRRTVNE